jgi:hypothetical protein
MSVTKAHTRVGSGSIYTSQQDLGFPEYRMVSSPIVVGVSMP